MLTKRHEEFNGEVERRNEGRFSRNETLRNTTLIALGASAAALLTYGLLGDNRSIIAGSDDVQAQEAETLYTDVDIALIAFEMDSEDASIIGEEIEDAFNTATDGMVTIDITMVEPSQEAQAQYAEVNADDCIARDLSNYGSYIADTTMPELAEYDKILALNNDPSCGGDFMGVAQKSGRHAEVVETAKGWEAIEANGGTQSVRTELEGGSAMTTYLYSPVDTGVHELLHLFGVGHSGKMVSLPQPGLATNEMQTYSMSDKHSDLDIPEIISKQQYQEYGGSDVMGRGNLTLWPKLSTIERYILDWPNRQLNQDGTVFVKDIAKGPVLFEEGEWKDVVATYQLERPISIDEENEMDTLVFVPATRIVNKEEVLDGVKMLLLNEANDFVEVGELRNAEGLQSGAKTSYTLQFEGEALVVSLDYKTSRVTIDTQN